jgi:hypothetical protein
MNRLFNMLLHFIWFSPSGLGLDKILNLITDHLHSADQIRHLFEPFDPAVQHRPLSPACQPEPIHLLIQVTQISSNSHIIPFSSRATRFFYSLHINAAPLADIGDAEVNWFFHERK